MCSVVRYADDTALTGQIANDNDLHYIQAINTFVDWCDNNYLELNVSKTKEMIIDFQTKQTTPILL